MKKICFKCGAQKPIKEFYKHKQMADGHLNKCKDCTKSDVSRNYRENIDHYKDYERGRAMAPHRIEARAEYMATESGKIAHAKASARWTKRNPVKRLANMMVGNAVRDGRLVKPQSCEDCKSTPKRLHGHHDDYAMPLKVRWLCPGCHNKWHKENGEGKNAF